MSDEPKIEYSKLCQEIASGSKSVSVEVYRIEDDPSWQLEVVDEFGNSTVWDETFENDSDAVAAAQKTVLADGIESLIGPEGDEVREGWL